MGIILIVVAVIICLYFIGKSGNKIEKTPYAKTPEVRIPENKTPEFKRTTKSYSKMEFYCKVSGVQHYCTKDDIGGFLGYVAPDINNAYDKNACAIYRNDNKLLGYIPKEELQDYRIWSGCKQLNCVGYIKTGTGVPLFGKVKVINNADEFETELIIVKYVRWLVVTFGKKYIPKGFTFDTDMPLKTKDDWIIALDDYIEFAE